MPSVRTPDSHSPYSTVSACSAHIRACTAAIPTPYTANHTKGRTGTEGGVSAMPAPPAAATTPATRYARFFPTSSTIFGIAGLTTNMAPVVSTVNTIV